VIEIFPNLYVGTGHDLIHVDDGAKGIKEGWYVISAAKEPWHREALGYTGRGAPKDHIEYLIANRTRRLILNLVDVDNPEFIREEIIAAARENISMALERGDKVLVHCNQGGSRAPTIALLWLHAHDPEYAGLDYDGAAEKFREVYPDFAPANGMEGYARANWEKAS
jgi:hypothetical protein